MSSVTLKEVSLDYIVKTGTDSLKQSVVQILNKCVKKDHVRPVAIRNSAYRALNNINLTIKTGDRIGIVGRNGAGKSTLLRVLGKVYRPNHGQVLIHGKISSLFDINLGMNIEATGYENIINLSLMRGVSKKEARDMIQDVENFTELGEHLKYPVRTYSAGMRMKLAFAVATANVADIMLIDEVIGVGDSHFMDKAIERLENSIESSHILVLTSHAIETIERFCNKVLVLEAGEIKFLGSVQEGLDYYKHMVG